MLISVEIHLIRQLFSNKNVHFRLEMVYFNSKIKEFSVQNRIFEKLGFFRAENFDQKYIFYVKIILKSWFFVQKSPVSLNLEMGVATESSEFSVVKSILNNQNKKKDFFSNIVWPWSLNKRIGQWETSFKRLCV